MSSERFAALSRRERECLRLVAQALSSKEIAARIGLSPHTVDDHLRSAKRTLEAPDRRAAARMLVEYEARSTPPQPLRDQPPAIGRAPDPGLSRAAIEVVLEAEEIEPVMLREEPVAYDPGPTDMVPSTPRSIKMGEPTHAWTATTKLRWIGGATLALIVLSAVVAVLLEALSKIIWRMAHLPQLSG